MHAACLPAVDDRARMLAQVALQAAAGDESGVIAVGGDQYEGAGLAVGGALVRTRIPSGERAARAPLAFKQGQQGSEGCFHVPRLCQAAEALCRAQTLYRRRQ